MGQKLYANGIILTMEKQMYAEAVLVKDGRIAAVGRKAAVEACAGADTERVDLEGRTMMPAFLDAHSHFMACANGELQISLDGTKSFREIAERVREYIAVRHVEKGKWLTGKGYDHNFLEERFHPDRHLLDEAAPDNPLVITHQSGHMGVFNTEALLRLGISMDGNGAVREIPGGKIAVQDHIPTGYMEENAFVEFQKKIPLPSPEEFMDAVEKAQKRYASHGITLIQEGLVVDEMLPLYQKIVESGILKLDVVGYLDMKGAGKFLEAMGKHREGFLRHFKIGGYKIFLDGSPQGRTAWLRMPYTSGPEKEGYRGYPVHTDEEVCAFVRRALEEHMQILAHCNGDAACGQYIRVFEKAAAAEGKTLPADIRPVMIHAQLLGLDQIPNVKAMGMIPSFFAGHVYHWGDIHADNLGMERASHISPAASAEKEGIAYTFHQDAPVIEPDMLETVWCAVNRCTKNGKVLGSKERISVTDALKAITVNTAYQYFEERERGSIAPGKRADFVILSENPLEKDKMQIRDIRVLATIKDGDVIYRRDTL